MIELYEFSLGSNLYTFGRALLGDLRDWSMIVRKKEEKRQNGTKRRGVGLLIS